MFSMVISVISVDFGDFGESCYLPRCPVTPETVVMAPSLNSFKNRLNKAWKNHPSKSSAQCYIPRMPTRIVQHTNESQEAELLE